MKIQLQKKLILVGWKQLIDISHTRIKGRSRKSDTSIHCAASDEIRKQKGEYFCEYRLVKEKDGYIFREVLHDTGISGHHRTIKSAVTSALSFVDIYIDEPYQWEATDAFQLLKEEHLDRENFKMEVLNSL